MVDTYLPSLAHTIKATTLHDYRKRAGYYILPTLGDYALHALRRPIIVAWLTAMLEYRDPKSGAPWGLSSIRQALRLLQRTLDAALQERLIDDNPAASVKPPLRREGDERIIEEDGDDGDKALTPEQVTKLLTEAQRTDRMHTPAAHHATGTYALYCVALKTGLRRGELLGLRWRDVDFERGELKVRQQVVRMDNTISVTTPKSASARRTVPMTDELVTLLKTYKLQLGERGRVLVFPGANGEPRQPNGVNQQFRRICARIGLVGYTFHDLRRTAITRWREAGVDSETVAALAGHANAKVTLNVYSDPEARKRDAIQRTG